MIKYQWLLLILLLFSCNKNEDNNYGVKENLSDIDKLFINGGSIKLCQIYVMAGVNTIPYLDIPKDSLFKNNVCIDIDKFAYISKDSSIDILKGIVKNEVWIIDKMKNTSKTVYVEHGFGSTYCITKSIINESYNTIKCHNNYGDKYYAIKIDIGSPYNYRGHDNYSFNFNYVDNINGIGYNTNLNFEILTKNGVGLFGKELYLDTNPVFNIRYQLSNPLTSNEVKNKILNGEYTLYLYKGLTTYNIDGNLYIPRYNGYVYIGNVNTNGMVTNIIGKYYRFKFIINN